MNRNLIKLYACMLLVAAALVGCGGTDNNPIVTPGPDAQESDTNQPDNQVQPDADAAPEVSIDSDACPNKLGDPCTSPGQPSTCGKLICNCDGKLINDDGTLNAPCPDEAGVDADADSPIQTDSDAGTDAETGVETGTDADAQIEQDADASPEADADPVEADAEAGVDADGAVIDVPPPQEICGNGIDDDGNNLTDCQDPACTSYTSCQPEVCDGVDNNGNSLIDEGFECAKGSSAQCTLPNGKKGQATCQQNCVFGSCVVPVEICDDNYDNDGDNKTDCADPTCASFPGCQCINAIPLDPCPNIGEYSCGNLWRCTCSKVWGDPNNPGGYYCLQTEICNDNIDNDGDGKIDCKDADCFGNSVCPEICYDHIDNNGDGKVDCADPQCTGNPWCAEICDGIDNNGVNGIDEGFECPLGSIDTSCTTTCGSQGQRTCESGCHWGTCKAPLTESKCNDGKDDDCDGWTDCLDPDCWGTATCPHNFGTCSSFTPPGVPHSCGTWNQQALPQVGNRVFTGCANAENDQFAWIGGYTNMEFMHRTSTWNVITVPVTGSPGSANPDIVCLGTNQVYSVYNQTNAGNGVFIRWDGTSVTRLAEQQTNGLVIGPMCAADTSHVYFIGRDGSNLKDARMYKWNGSSLTTSPLPSFGDNTLGLAKMYCASPSSVFAAGSLSDAQTQSWRAALLHWDGTSWAMIQTPVGSYGFTGVHGTSACDVMAVGSSYTGSDWIGLTYQRNGSSWDAKTYSDLIGVVSLVKTAPFKYVLGGGSHGSMTPAQLGTDNGDFTV
ncbi:MAG: hypothetical protein PHC53_04200, partial [Patescibacteria group bacterium]|nr:hypothetical protein [Patescibacteria group bacterium]